MTTNIQSLIAEYTRTHEVTKCPDGKALNALSADNWRQQLKGSHPSDRRRALFGDYADSPIRFVPPKSANASQYQRNKLRRQASRYLRQFK
ncbi:hypothetical protein [uncultured Sulfuricurvum sp.]|uniref:hypothetical protein n=1 Tax=uncultured Sulfuricurvum sp. TaxID=430693 RepID=UPI002604343D|nr:hypothetical protein [uncultured Sulfuricurvum sp.]